jgi:hypothetical protein
MPRGFHFHGVDVGGRKFGFDAVGGVNITLEFEDVGSTGTSISGEPIARACNILWPGIDAQAERYRTRRPLQLNGSTDVANGILGPGSSSIVLFLGTDDR